MPIPVVCGYRVKGSVQVLRRTKSVVDLIGNVQLQLFLLRSRRREAGGEPGIVGIEYLSVSRRGSTQMSFV